jgi:very-short-patch-repair endonuclease
MTRISLQTRAQARQLRTSMTPQERRLWQALRDLNLRIGTKFRRQAAIGPYIADFADYGRRLVIEIDGGQHGEVAHAIRDVRRDGFLSREGFTVLRFWNSEVNANLDGVLQIVLDAVEATADQNPPPQPSPRGGGSLSAQGEGASPPPCGEGLGEGGATRPGDHTSHQSKGPTP